MLLKFFSLVALVATPDAFANPWIPSHGSESRPHDDLNNLKIIIYETGKYSTSLQTFLGTAEKYGVESYVVGQGSTFSGFGSKYEQLKDTLDQIQNDPSALVAVIDGRDVLLNVNQNVDSRQFELRLDDFIETFKELTTDKPQAVLMSAEQQCCVAALCHADSPSHYFDPTTGKRNQRACPSGEEGCGWDDNANVQFWQSLMMAEAYANTGAKEISPYLNAGMMVGTAKNLIEMIDRMDLGEEEDDQAVLSAMYIQSPHLIALDYEQQLLGNNAWPKGFEAGCIYDFDAKSEEQTYLTNTQTGTSPLLLHTPGKFYSCLDTLIERLGGISDKRYMIGTERHLNYGNSNYQPTNINYGTLDEGGQGVAEPLKDSEEEPELNDLARLYDEDEEDEFNGSALTWGISCAAAAAVIAGLATKRRQIMTQEQAQHLRQAMENSEHSFSLDPEIYGDEPSVVSSAVDSAADPDEMDFQTLDESTKQPFNSTGSFEEIPVDNDQRGMKTMLASPFDCDDICGRRPGAAEDLRRHRTVHW
jgi:hypothetical protein